MIRNPERAWRGPSWKDVQADGFEHIGAGLSLIAKGVTQIVMSAPGWYALYAVYVFVVFGWGV